MNGFTKFLADPQVHDTMLWTMVITSFLGAIRRYKAPANWLQTFWNFLYDWATGFWSMKSGQPLRTSTQQLEEHTDGATKDLKVTASTETAAPAVAAPPFPPSPATPNQP
jgi:hypothetical protein